MICQLAGVFLTLLMTHTQHSGRMKSLNVRTPGDRL